MFLDRKARELVVRLAYAGQPLSGKTQSIRTLASLLRGPALPADVLSPKESRGRTLYFDWTTYRGGSFRGRRVRCQILTVPGQEALARRRQFLIQSADAVVFVVDSDPEHVNEARSSYREMLPWLERVGRKRIPVIVQCNKRDLPTAVSLDRIRAVLELDARSALFESTATDGKGIRATFVAALRSVVDYADLVGDAVLNACPPEVESGERMLELMQSLEAGAAEPAWTAQLEVPERRIEPERAIEPERRIERRIEPEKRVEPEKPVESGRRVEPLRRLELVEGRRGRPWSGEGARPAVMPAADWHRLKKKVATPDATAVERIEPSSKDSNVVRLASSAHWAAAHSVSRLEGGSSRSESGRSDTQHGPRPAVMPSVSWLARNRANDATAALAVDSDPAASSSVAEDRIAGRPSIPTLELATPELGVTPTAPPDSEWVMLPGDSEGLPVEAWPTDLWNNVRAQFYAPPRRASLQDGVWVGEVAPQWLGGSASIFGDLGTAHEALALEVERCKRLSSFLWPYRCFALCTDGQGYWRLWEIVRNAVSLEQILQRILAQGLQTQASLTAGRLVAISQAYLRSVMVFSSAPEPLPVTFANIGQHNGALAYTGFLLAVHPGTAAAATDPMDALEAQLRLCIPGQTGRLIDVPGVCRELQALAQDESRRPVVEMLCSLLIGQ